MSNQLLSQTECIEKETSADKASCLFRCLVFFMLAAILGVISFNTLLSYSEIDRRRDLLKWDLQNVARLTQNHLEYYHQHSKWPKPGLFMNDDSTLLLLETYKTDSRRQDVYRTQTEGYQVQYDLLNNGQFEVHVRVID